jgi:iron(III) transport system permease protein
MALSFLYTLSSFGVPALLGLPVRQFVLTTLIYSEFKMGGLTGIYNGFKLSGVLVAIVLVVLATSYLLRRYQKSRGVTLVSGKASKPSQVHLGRWTLPVVGGLAAWVLITLVLPWVALGLSALASVAGDFRVSQWTLRNFKTVLTLADFQESVRNSLSYTAVTSVVLVVLGFGLGYLAVRRQQRWARAIIGMSQISFALPGTVIALALTYAMAWTGWFWDSVFWMLLAYGLKYAAVPFQMLSTGFSHVHPSLEEAAQMSGARRGRVIRTIWVPLLKTVWMSAGLLVALPILTELTMSVLLTGPGRATLGTVLFQLQEYADQPSAAAMGFMILSAAAIGAWTQSLLLRRKKDA